MLLSLISPMRLWKAPCLVRIWSNGRTHILLFRRRNLRLISRPAVIATISASSSDELSIWLLIFQMGLIYIWDHGYIIKWGIS